jgi:hypothetical protein
MLIENSGYGIQAIAEFREALFKFGDFAFLHTSS